MVLDNEALQALAHLGHPKHRVMIAKVLAVAHESRVAAPVLVLTPTAVRVEAALSRRTPAAATLGRLRVRDVVLDSARADRSAELAAQTQASAVDATVAEVADSEALTRRVTIFTSDLEDIGRLVGHLDSAASIHVRRI